MGRFDTIKTTIDANIKENGSQEITGQKMNSVLTEMVNATDAELTELESKTDIIEQSIYDFAISDDDGNDILTIKDGEIKTKNFDSKETTCTKDSNEVDGLSICDEMDNDIVTFDNGGIKTKNFDSKLLKDMTPFAIIYQNQSCPFGVDHEKYFVRSAKAIYAKNYIPLIIVAGQSNADGRIPYTEAPSWLVSEDYKVRGYKVWDGISFKDYNVKGMTGARDKNTYSFDAVFAKKFLEYTGFENLYMIRQTIGGIGMESQPISDSAIAANVNWTWQPDITRIDKKCQSMCLALQDKVYRAMSYATMVGKRLLPIAILWHQGENEADTNNVDKCENNLSNLICFIRGLFGSPTLPFINAFINGNHSESYANINKIFEAMNEMDSYMSTINMDGHYNMLQDGYDAHYNAEEINYMGEQMFENLKKYL